VKLVLIPGWNEAAGRMRLLVEGRRGLPGLASAGFDCSLFDIGSGSLTQRVEQFAAFLSGLRAASASAPVGVLGYSAGGVIARGFLREHPERAHEIAATLQLAAPNAGIVTDDLGGLLRGIRMSGDVIEDLDIESDFMRRLNGVGGHWETVPGTRDKTWKLDGEPWVAPPGARICNIAGRMPRYENRSDGIVLVESATLNDRLTHVFIDGRQANHLNLSGVSNLVTTLFRRWRADDAYWPRVVDEARRFFS
jgi:pimeloyl-ACP methyl ester carboxylesterase